MMTRTHASALVLLLAGCSLDYDAIPRGMGPGLDGGGGGGFPPGYLERCEPFRPGSCDADLLCVDATGPPGTCYLACDHSACERECINPTRDREFCEPDCGGDLGGCGDGAVCHLVPRDPENPMSFEAVVVCRAEGPGGPTSPCMRPEQCGPAMECLFFGVDSGQCMPFCGGSLDPCPAGMFCLMDQPFMWNGSSYGLCLPM